jgi:hypothetical protein
VTCRAWDPFIGIIKPHENNAMAKRIVETTGLATWDLCKKIPSSLHKCSRIRLLLRKITFWRIWVERNDLTFSNNRWDFYEDLTNDMARPP